ncbi:MAG: hypothetical protein ACM3X6_08380 [Patescibacteria group bacterium]
MITFILVASLAAGITSAVSAVFEIIRHNNHKHVEMKRITITSEDGLSNTYVLPEDEFRSLLDLVDRRIRITGDESQPAATKQ